MSPLLGEVSCTDKSMTVFSSLRPPQRRGGGKPGSTRHSVRTGKNVIFLCSLLVSGEGHPGDFMI